MRAKGGGENGNIDVKVLNKIDYSKIDEKWTIAASGLAVRNDLYDIIYYDIRTNSMCYIKATDNANECKFVWLKDNNVSSVYTKDIVGNPVTEITDGLVSIPDGAKYIAFSLLKTDTETGMYKFELS